MAGNLRFRTIFITLIVIFLYTTSRQANDYTVRTSHDLSRIAPQSLVIHKIVVTAQPVQRPAVVLKETTVTDYSTTVTFTDEGVYPDDYTTLQTAAAGFEEELDRLLQEELEKKLIQDKINVQVNELILMEAKRQQELDMQTGEGKETDRDRLGQMSNLTVPSQKQTPPTLVLVVNSLGRGGSTFTAEIMSTFSERSITFFEPLSVLQENGIEFTVEHTSTILKAAFDCDFQGIQEKYGPLHYLTFKYTKNCHLNIECITKMCLDADIRLIKVIRLPLAQSAALLTDPQYSNLRLLYLARDPRPQIASRIRFMNKTNPSQGIECPTYTTDLRAYRDLSLKFPASLHIIRHEDLCVKLYERSRELLRFVWGVSNDSPVVLPGHTVGYLKQHSGVESERQKRGLSTKRDSSKEWYDWRFFPEIHKRLKLPIVEADCEEVMRRLGYVPMGDWVTARNLSIESVVPYDCKYFNSCDYANT